MFVSSRIMELDDHFPVLHSSSLVKSPKNSESPKIPKNPENPKNSNSSAVMNGLPSVSRVHSVKLLDCLEAASSPVVPILNPAGSPCLESAKPKWTEVVASPSNTSGSTRMTLSYHPPSVVMRRWWSVPLKK